MAVRKKFDDITKNLKKTIKLEKKKFMYRNLTISDSKKVWKSLNEMIGRKMKDNVRAPD